MTEREYNFRQSECKNNTCYHCYCNGLPTCFKESLVKTIPDFPSRDYAHLTEKEKQKIMKLPEKQL